MAGGLDDTGDWRPVGVRAGVDGVVRAEAGSCNPPFWPCACCAELTAAAACAKNIDAPASMVVLRFSLDAE